MKNLFGRSRLSKIELRKRDGSPSSVPLGLLVGLVGLSGLVAGLAAVTTLSLDHPGPAELGGLGVLLAAAILAERFPVPIPGVGAGGVSLAAVFIVSAGYLYGWAPAVLAAAATRGVIEIAQRRPLQRTIYNCATYALAAAGAGRAGQLAPHTTNVHWLIVDAATGSATFYAVNVALIALVIATVGEERIDKVLGDAVSSTAPAFAIMFSVSLMLDALWERAPILSTALLGPLMAIALYQRSASRERQAMELALTDPLTGLGNYRAFQIRLEALLDEADDGGSVSLCVLDLDDFKEINDTCGHPIGDRVLASVADCIREDGEAFRLGGDEFALLLPGSTEEEAVTVASEAVLRISTRRADRSRAQTASAGVATYPAAAVDRSHVVRAADRALYAAKASGRNAVRSFQVDTIELSERRIAAEGEIRARLDAASCLARTIEGRDAYTHEHCDAVADLAARLATALGLDGESIELLRLAGRVHDVGKLAIPEEVLRKPGSLNQLERRTIETHSQIGYRMLSSLGIEPVATWVLHHHEHWDGTGYPHGLSGEAIPIGSRILAVADAYEAMTTDRIYKESVTSAEAVAELRQCARTQFDPRVVDALVAVLGLEEIEPPALAVA